MNTLSTVEARKSLSEIINQAAYGGEPTIIERRGKPVAVVVSVEDFEAMEALEDYLDVQEAEKRMKEDGAVTLKEFRASLED
ncbi:MAG TPA: type II toxin-antitoxin system Phd/YefM family antitoxin [Rhodothermales bacterium]|nr:type II toxin-antitoxin system Phd/YefM family antitoxin [Rhodothermales bacterium]